MRGTRRFETQVGSFALPCYAFAGFLNGSVAREIMKAAISIDQEDVARFSAQADSWWDEHGSFAPLHKINPTRIRYIRDAIVKHFSREETALQPFTALSLLDIGCGGGLVAEPMTRLGAAVSAIDASERNIAVASAHAAAMGLTIEYRASSAEELAESGMQFDIVLALEIVEHVADLDAFMKAVTALVKPGGLLILSTLNRTAKSYALGIIAAEYILRWIPRGTHQWKKFLRPSELAHSIRSHGLLMEDLCGMIFDPFTREWKLQPRDLAVNYFLTATKPE